MRRFEGKRVIITGGANGIGKATVAHFAAEGTTIVLTDVNGRAAEAAARQMAGETGATILPFDAVSILRPILVAAMGQYSTPRAAQRGTKTIICV